MLQQTQAPRVIEPFRHWVERFPDPRACARAGPGEALRAWSGLGYNGRALRLQRASVVITEAHGGQVPRERAALEALPGVGPYTARAVMVFAFGTPIGVVDTNVARVLSRAVAGRRLRPAECQCLADQLVPPDNPWEYTQTLFDIGVLHCRAGVPRCEGCPLSPLCAWASLGCPSPDPAAPANRQSRFVGSDRQGRGRLVDALRCGPVCSAALPAACGWESVERSHRVAETLVRDGLAVWAADGLLALP